MALGLQAMLSSANARFAIRKDVDFSMASLTFSVTSVAPTATFEVDKVKSRSVGTDGAKRLYTLISDPFDAKEADAMRMAKARLIDEIIESGVTDMGKSALFNFALKNVSMFLAARFPPERTKILSYIVAHDTVGLGPISILLDDSEELEEIEINSPMAEIAVYHRRYGRCSTNLRFNSEVDFRYTINRLAAASGKELGQTNKVIDAQLGTCRLHAQTGPYSIGGGSASIRLDHSRSIGLRDVLIGGVLSSGVMAYLWMAIECGKNIVICGAPGAGKTTILTILSAFVPADCRAITIEEDINEIHLDRHLGNVVQLQSGRYGAGLADQIRNALHMRPEILFVGEIRGAEANDVFSGSNIGIPFMTTMHSDGNGNELIARLRSKPMHMEDGLLQKLDISLFVRKNAEGSRKVESIVEYLWERELGAVPLNVMEIASGSSVKGAAIEGSLVLAQYAKTRGVGRELAFKEFKNRTRHIDMLTSGNFINTDPYEHVRNYRQ